MRLRVLAVIVAAVAGVATALLGAGPAAASFEIGGPNGYEAGSAPDGQTWDGFTR